MLHALMAQRADIHLRWEALLRVEPVNSPLGQPDALKHMVDYTLDTLFAALKTPRPRPPHSSCAAKRALCPCGRNPLLAYFVAGEQALLETLILLQGTIADTVENRTAAAATLKEVLAQTAHREIETFCAVCQFRERPGTATAKETGPAAVGATARPAH